jgi:hypothetical protein
VLLKTTVGLFSKVEEYLQYDSSVIKKNKIKTEE